MNSCKKSCGYCCTLRVRLSFLDILRIMKAGHKRKDFIEKDLKGKPIIKMNNGKCYFLYRKNKKARCKIYDNRPKICSTYPFFNDSIKNCDELKTQKRFLQ